MISTIKKGIVIKKFPYNDKHEILYILLETGTVTNFFYENGARNKKKINILSHVNIIYIERNGLNKIINIELEDSYNSIMSDLKLQMYIGNILEMLIIVNTISVSISYSSFEQLLYKIDRNNIDVELASAYFICKILTSEGFKFKYKKVKNYYTGYDFSKNIFTNELSQPMIYTLTNKLVKLIHILSINNIDVLEKITLNKVEYTQLLDFLVKVLKEYTGIETKTYKKIQEIECMLESFERKKDNE